MKRKTFPIRQIVKMVNKLNKESVCSSAVREGWNSFVESILMETDTYDGFRPLSTDEVPVGQLPGMIIDPSGLNAHKFPDETRKQFFLPHSV